MQRGPFFPERLTPRPEVLLGCARISKHFGGTRALHEVDWELRPGEVHALCGENGAGKSTLARILCGISAPDGGEIQFAGEAVAWTSATAARRAGIGIVQQELDLFAGLSIAENLALGHPRLERSAWVSFTALSDAVRPFLADVGLELDPATPLARLSVSQWQLVAIARALSLAARVIFMDEPTSALPDDAAERLFKLIGELKARGVAIVYVSHKMTEIFRIADRISVLRDGEMIATSRREETSVEQIIQQMVGRAVAARRAPPPRAFAGAPRLRVSDLHTRKLRGVSFDLAAGEILGVAGLVASGRSELGRALFGLSPVVAGEIAIDNVPYQPNGVRGAMARGLALVPEDRRRDGLVSGMSVRHNVTLASLARFSRSNWIDEPGETTAADALLGRCRVKHARGDQAVSALSGGNQQKVLIAKWLLRDARVYFFDDPTRGIDVGAKDDIYRILAELAAAGAGIIWVSSELPELLANAHRVLVLHEGAVAGILPAAGATQEALMHLATGHAA